MDPTSKRRKLSHSSSASEASESGEELAVDRSSPSEEPQNVPAEDPKTFQELGVVESLCEACTALGYTKPTPIQARSIPVALSGRDVIGIAETGSGKTAAFVLPILSALLDKPQPLFGLVLAPTRELAVQIGKTFEALGSLISLRCAVIVGGLDMVQQAIALGKKPHVIVASPGRLLDHLEKTKGFSLRNLKYLVLDEADRLLDMDFGPSIDKILKFIPRERRTYLFSATMSRKVERLQRASLRDPVAVSVSASKYQTVQTLQQNYILIPQPKKDIYLIYLANEFVGKKMLVFTRTVHETQRLAILFRTLGFGAIPLHGQLAMSARLQALNKFREGSRDILVATDIAARGLDIPKVHIVLNYDLPSDSMTYIHRVGRTARIGNFGLALSMVTQYDYELWQRIEAALGKKFTEYGTEKDEVMVFQERVDEAQRHARREMKALMDNRGKRGAVLKGNRSVRGSKRRHDEMDAEEG